MEPTSVYNYRDIIYSCFLPAESLSEYRLRHHALVYVYSGEIQLAYNGRQQHVRAGEYLFLKRDHRLHIHKHTLGSAPYKAISIRFDRRFLRYCFRTLDAEAFPPRVRRFTEAAVKLPPASAAASGTPSPAGPSSTRPCASPAAATPRSP